MADRIEREIEEILKKLDDFVPEGRTRPRQPRRVNSSINNAQSWFGRTLSAISLNQVMLWSLVLFFVMFIFRGIPGASWIMIASLVVLATAFVLSIVSPGSGSGGAKGPEKRWRGQPIDYSDPGWPTRVKSWLKGRKRS